MLLRPAYGVDIETDTSPETAEELAAGYKPGNRGLDPRIGRIENIAVAHDKGVEVFREDTETDLLIAFLTWLYQAEPGVIFDWNGSVFDWPFITDRMKACGIAWNMVHLRANPLLVPKYEPLPNHDGGYDVAVDTKTGIQHVVVDTAYLLKSKAAELGVPWSLKPTCKALGLQMVEVDRQNIHLLSQEEQDAYVASDAAGARDAGILALSGKLGPL